MVFMGKDWVYYPLYGELLEVGYFVNLFGMVLEARDPNFFGSLSYPAWVGYKITTA